jgi:hypothetical protein
VDAWAQAAQHLVLGDRGEADQHDDAVAEQHRIAAFADTEGERDLGNEIAALETSRIKPFAQQMEAGREAKAGHRGQSRLRVTHERTINRFETRETASLRALARLASQREFCLTYPARPAYKRRARK